MDVAKGLQRSIAENMRFTTLVKDKRVHEMMTGWAKKRTIL
jgi:hypothetical protein